MTSRMSDSHAGHAAGADPTDSGPLFASILCAIDDTRTAHEAALQAAQMAAPDARLTYLSVPYRTGVGPRAMAEFSPDRAREALDRAAREAKQLGVAAEAELVEDPKANEVVLERAHRHDLLVLGAPVAPRHAGIVLGGMATAAAHEADVPVLLARRPPAEHPFPSRIVVASDGSDQSSFLVELAAELGRRHQGQVTLVHVREHEPDDIRHRLAEQATILQERLGVEPIVDTEPRPVHDAIVAAAQRDDASLVVVGSRCLHGVRALGSVSERVAHQAKCSVLILRPPAGD